MGRIVLQGSVDGKRIEATLHQVDVKFRLQTRGFHWINEFPFNR